MVDFFIFVDLLLNKLNARKNYELHQSAHKKLLNLKKKEDKKPFFFLKTFDYIYRNHYTRYTITTNINRQIDQHKGIL